MMMGRGCFWKAFLVRGNSNSLIRPWSSVVKYNILPSFDQSID